MVIQSKARVICATCQTSIQGGGNWVIDPWYTLHCTEEMCVFLGCKTAFDYEKRMEGFETGDFQAVFLADCGVMLDQASPFSCNPAIYLRNVEMWARTAHRLFSHGNVVGLAQDLRFNTFVRFVTCDFDARYCGGGKQPRWGIDEGNLACFRKSTFVKRKMKHRVLQWLGLPI